MGLFSKDSPAEKKLKELTGGRILSISFIDRLKSKGLDSNVGIKIKKQLKQEIRNGAVNEHNMESRLNELINRHSNKNTTSTNQKKCPKCNESQDEVNKFCISCGYEFKAEKTCPICNEAQDMDNAYCISCGYDFNDKRVKPIFKNCPNCNKKVFNISKTCIACGYDFKNEEMPDDAIICPNCNKKTKKSSKKCPNCGYDFTIKRVSVLVDNMRKFNFLSNYEFNLKTCPDCNTKFLKTDPFCFNCGASVVTNQTIKNDNLEVKNGKLVAKEESNQDELKDLEALYSHTVQSRYAPSFKFAYVLYLEEFRKNPTKKFSDKTAKHYDTTVNKLKKQALEDEFIEPAPPLTVAKDSKVSDLKEILKEHNLKVSGKKDELIERLGENLTDDELKKYFKSKTYQISDKGLDFLSKTSYILYIHEEKEISRAISSYEISKIFEEKQYSIEEIQDIILGYLKRIFDDKLSQELWVDFKIYANAIASVLEDKNELKEALNIRLKVFLFDINNFSIVTARPDPRKTKLKQKDMSKLMELMHNLSLPIYELKEVFNQAYGEVLFKMAITKEDSFVYLLKIFGGEDLDKVSREINESYSNPY